MIDKKAIKEEFKKYVPEKGIFMIKNISSGRVFLGGSMNMHEILKKHKFMLDLNSHRNQALQDDYNKYGADDFEFSILELLNLKDEIDYNYEEDLQILEMLWVDKFQPIKENLYNKNEKIRTH